MTVKAIYENGVVRPREPVHLRHSEKPAVGSDFTHRFICSPTSYSVQMLG